MTSVTFGKNLEDKEFWRLHPNFESLKPNVIAVLPMDNLSLEPDLEKVLYNEVYKRLTEKGYMKISAQKVDEVMKSLGIQTPGQLAGISLNRLCKELGCEAVLTGQIEQSAAIHGGVIDAVVVSCSLSLINGIGSKGEVLWHTEQWRTAHRQFQIDPFNILLNLIMHERASREDRIKFLVHEMLKTLPQGIIDVSIGNDLLEKAQEIPLEDNSN